MKKYIVEKRMSNSTDGYFVVVVEGETHLNRKVIKSDVTFFTLQGGYDYCDPIERAVQNANAIAKGLNELEQLKEQQRRIIVNDETYNVLALPK